MNIKKSMHFWFVTFFHQVDPSGMMMTLKACDGQVIQVKLQQPLQVYYGFAYTHL